jgi:hypothetical protein
MAALTEQMEMLRTNQANISLPWSLEKLLWDNSKPVELMTAKTGYTSPMVDPPNPLNPGANEFVPATEEFPDFLPPQIPQTQ